MHNAIETLSPPISKAAQVRRAIIEKLRPYVGYVEGWQLRLAYLKAQLGSSYATREERELAAGRLDELRSEIEVSRQRFLAEAELWPRHDRIDDVQRSMDRLLSQIAVAR
ncbi:hypothetical protein PRN20_17210 [Devosia sp. ZB163]|uniref:hypothetical protein n=1 Tax=Devosia sp. ZB163 TaxID=3025938 RepID=UPI00236188ED|nr:hypothetical protein [Devosia sp. ZB163]MDC9825473.1 hypothetical protein [Devosia sp. ZB163]